MDYIKHLQKCIYYIQNHPETLEKEETKLLLDFVMQSVDHYMSYSEKYDQQIIVDEEDKDLLALYEWYVKTDIRGKHEDTGKTLLLRRLIMERKLGRKLEKERVYNVDGNPCNLKRDNLELTSGRIKINENTYYGSARSKLNGKIY